MFYIHQYACISPQQTFGSVDIEKLHAPVEKRYKTIEPVYNSIPPGILRRMGKSVRMGVGAAMSIIKDQQPDGIIIGTANGGKEDCVKFLNQIVEYDEGLLTPINFVQSTPNAIAAQIGLLTKNRGYNITHLHNGLAFEYAAIDADMLLHENSAGNYLLGAVDDISEFNFNLEEKRGWHKKEVVSIPDFYDTVSPGSIPGEAACMFFVNNNPAAAVGKVIAVDILHSSDEALVKEKMEAFLKNNLPPGEKIDLFLSGENADERLSKFFIACESLLEKDTAIARFKHMCGEYPTASSVAWWLACYILQDQPVPGHIMKRDSAKKANKNILIYNCYKGIQHGFTLLSRP